MTTEATLAAMDTSLLDEMLAGYGSKFPTLDVLLNMQPTEKYLQRIVSPIPGLGRYADSTEFLSEITSGKNIGKLRFKVAKKYLFALSRLMENYDGKYKDQKIIDKLTPEQAEAIEKIGTTVVEIFQAEQIEKFTEHDTAAATDYIKLRMAKLALEDPERFGKLMEYLEAVHYACTSDDNIGNVFGLMLNELVLGHFMDALFDFCLEVIDYVIKFEEEGILVLPELTHLQSAEPNTPVKTTIVRLRSIKKMVKKMMNRKKEFIPFSGKLGGAIGNLTCHFAAYPDINWYEFARKFVEEDLGLTYEEHTDQCPTYVVEAQHYSEICNILVEVTQFLENFCNWVSCPAQLFVKVKKTGQKGSSIMPGKSNLWGIEGAIIMLKKMINSLRFTGEELRRYPRAGNMARSFLMRDAGNDFMPAFIAFPRALKELKQCVPNKHKIEAFLREYPGMAGSALQTVLKRMRIKGDAYREIQSISINPDGSYANAEQFAVGLDAVMEKLNLSEQQRQELKGLLDFENLVRPSYEKASEDIRKLRRSFELFKLKTRKHRQAA